jgi:hypothetical protein
MRGIYPDGVTSLAEESLLWENAQNKLPPFGKELLDLLPLLFIRAVQSFDGRWQPPQARGVAQAARQQFVSFDEADEIVLDINENFAVKLHAYAQANARALGLDPGKRIQVRGFHPVFRVAPNGRLLIEVVAQFAQQDTSLRVDLGGIPFRGGVTLIASAEGQIRYLISKPMPLAGDGDPTQMRQARARLDRQHAYLNLCDMQNPRSPYLNPSEHQRRMAELMSFASLHGG